MVRATGSKQRGHALDLSLRKVAGREPGPPLFDLGDYLVSSMGDLQ